MKTESFSFSNFWLIYFSISLFHQYYFRRQYFSQKLWWWWWWLVAKLYPTHVTPWTAARHASLSSGFPRQDTGVGCYFLLQGIFPTQESNPCLLHCRQVLYCWTTGKPFKCYIEAIYSFKKHFFSHLLSQELCGVLKNAEIIFFKKSTHSLLLS